LTPTGMVVTEMETTADAPLESVTVIVHVPPMMPVTLNCPGDVCTTVAMLGLLLVALSVKLFEEVAVNAPVSGRPLPSEIAVGLTLTTEAGVGLGAGVGAAVAVGVAVGAVVGTPLGAVVGAVEGADEGRTVGVVDGTAVGADEGFGVGVGVGVELIKGAGTPGELLPPPPPPHATGTIARHPTSSARMRHMRRREELIIQWPRKPEVREVGDRSRRREVGCVCAPRQRPYIVRVVADVRTRAQSSV